MDSRALERMRARARVVRTRSQVRAWKYRQRNLAAGVWFRIRRVLADAKAAYVISDEDAERLLSEGYEPLACGREVAPEKRIVFVDDRRLDRVESRRQIRVDLGPAFLAATAIALTRFDETGEEREGKRAIQTRSSVPTARPRH
jgi:hypothetical protein